MIAWLNDQLVDASVACVSVQDHGLTVGDGIFETLRCYDGRPFAVGRHLDRLAASAAALGLGPPPVEALSTALAEVVAANQLGDGVLRITVTSGPGPMGSGRGDAGPTVLVTAGPLPAWPATSAVSIVPWPRNERGALVGVKSTSYGENVVALGWARARGADEALFVNLAGDLCEGTGSNLFVAVDGRLVTPPLASGCLAGVTRALIVERCSAEEADLRPARLLEAEEAFLTSSTRQVHPIREVDGQALPAAPGPLTAAAIKTMAAAVATGF